MEIKKIMKEEVEQHQEILENLQPGIGLSTEGA